MEHLGIDPTRGPHAAAAVSDDDPEYVCKIILWKLAVRTEKQTFLDELRRVLEAGEQLGEPLAEVRNERDLMRFAAKMMADLDSLPPLERQESPIWV